MSEPNEEYLKLYQEVDSFLQYADEEAAKVPGSKWATVIHSDYLNAMRLKLDLLQKMGIK
ncbi:hypothetical protein CVD25_01045 [Bacillus canaveralius]|uniref:Uncharacterized protein n=1 Tax=Bacillus canaveralius TaxID=1403243 RepID=A0A2N5GPL8_9BACI|nr:hypothetical protein [Bacillus canaveralius]PLR84651.1 hypothetical protein CU635_06155 [Bacillus canaveralius]PLS00803.1 hypothetical protein CVD25_01045 [Bacillus canaveralius]